MVSADDLRALLSKYRNQHTFHITEALNRGLTQEYRTWHHIMAKAIEPLLIDLDALVPASPETSPTEDDDLRGLCERKPKRSESRRS